MMKLASVLGPSRIPSNLSSRALRTSRISGFYYCLILQWLGRNNPARLKQAKSLPSNKESPAWSQQIGEQHQPRGNLARLGHRFVVDPMFCIILSDLDSKSFVGSVVKCISNDSLAFRFSRARLLWSSVQPIEYGAVYGSCCRDGSNPRVSSTVPARTV